MVKTNYTVYVYLITNLKNGKRYVGLTMRSVEKRWSEHQQARSSRSPLHKAIKKYGPDSFFVETLWEGDDLEEAIEVIEPTYIRIMGAHASTGRGYNANYGGKHHRGGHTPSDETRRRMSESRKGRIHSDQHRKKISDALSGRYISSEWRNKLSEANTGKKASVYTRDKMSLAAKGKNKPEGFGEKVRQAHLGKTVKEETKQHLRKAKEKYKYLVIYPDSTQRIITNLTTFSKEVGVSRSGFGWVLSGKAETHRGFRIRRI